MLNTLIENLKNKQANFIESIRENKLTSILEILFPFNQRTDKLSSSSFSITVILFEYRKSFFNFLQCSKPAISLKENFIIFT